MTVKELIEKLQTLPQEAEVKTPMPDSGGYDWEVGSPTIVTLIKYGVVRCVWIGHDLDEEDLDEDDFEEEDEE